MSPISAARAVAAGLLGDEPLTQSQWAAVARRCATILRLADVDSLVVHSAGSFAGLLHIRGEPTGSELLEALPTPTRQPLSREAVHELHTTLLYATHATRTATPTAQRLLATTERELLSRHPRTPLEILMLHWRNQVATLTQPVAPSTAKAISTLQHFLLKATHDMIQRADIPGGAGQQRLLTQVAAAGHAWTTIRNRLHEPAPASPLPSHTELIETQYAMQTAMSRAGETDRLAALLATGLAGNLIAAHRIAPSPTSPVLHTALRLDRHLDLLAHQPITLTPRPTRPVTARPPTPASGIRMIPNTGHGVARGTRPEVRTTDVGPADKEGHHRLGRIMQAGIIADAALQGDPHAKQIVGTTSRTDLEQLVQDGHAARNGLVASVLGPLAGSLIQRSAPRHLMEDLTQQVAVDLLRTAPRWDPQGGASWFTWAYRSALGTLSHDRRRALGRKDKAAMISLTDDLQTILADQAPGPEDQVIQRSAQQRLLTAIDQLPRAEQQALRSAVRNSLDGQGTYKAVGQELGYSRRVATRNIKAGRTKLIGLLTSQPTPGTRPPHPTPPRAKGPAI